MSDLSGKPIMLTEFHYGDPTQGLGCGLKAVENEDQKGKAYRGYVEEAAASGLIVGTHWFEYLDQATTGRYFQGLKGESSAVGLINVADIPYKTMMANVMETNYAIYDLVLGLKEPYKYVVEPAHSYNQKVNIEKTDEPIVIDGQKDADWPSGDTLKLTNQNKVLGAFRSNVSADINLLWDDNNLYIYADMKDPSPMQNAYTDFDIWNGDGLELFVGPEAISEKGTLKINDSQLIISTNGSYYWYNNRNTQPEISRAVKLVFYTTAQYK